MKGIFIMHDLIPTILTSFATTMATKGAEAPANTFNNIWQLVFGRFDNFLEKKNIELQLKHRQYIESITSKINNIPQDNLQEPKLSIIGPSLEASKFYIEEDDIREMFASLLASSFDSSKNNSLHHSFVEIIKQMNPLDARNLYEFSLENGVPVVSYRYLINDGSSGSIRDIVYINKRISSNTETDVLDKIINTNASSIINLQRLGLISVSFKYSLKDQPSYEIYNKNSVVEAINKELSAQSTDINLDINRGIISITPLGKDFINICFN